MDAKDPAAVALGRKGGLATSPAKSAAARANGAKGGRPPGRPCARCGFMLRGQSHRWATCRNFEACNVRRKRRAADQ